ncbi:taf-5 [Pristionchus pacificus]|nr:taf-5 [Pristionchus pacificus]
MDLGPPGDGPNNGPIPIQTGQQVVPPDILHSMLGFLRKYGYTDTEETLARESAIRSSGPASNQLPSNEAVAAEFATLLTHVDASFDFYQAEFSLLIFPVFAHSYLKLLIDGQPNLAFSFMDKYGLRVPSAYEEEVRTLASLTNVAQALANPIVQNLMKKKFLVKICKSSMKQLEPLLNRLPSISNILKERAEIEINEINSKEKSTVEWQMGAIVGQVGKGKHKMYHGMMKEECIYALDRMKSRQREDAKRREMNAPVADRIPLPPLSECLRQERLRAMKDSHKMCVIGQDQPPSVCFYTTLNGHGGVSSCDVSEDSSYLALGFGDSGISVFALNEDKKMRKMKGADDLDKLDTESDDIMEEMVENESAGVVTFNGHSAPIYSINFSPDKRILASTSGDNTIRLWSMQTQTNAVVIRVAAPIWQIAFCQRGYYYATASSSHTAAVWTTDRMHPLRIFADPLSHVSSVDFHANCNYIVGGSDDRYVRVWDVLSGACVRTFTGHRAPVRCTKFSPCGRYVVSVDGDGVTLVWDLSSQRLMGGDTRTFPTRIPSLSWSRDGGTFALSRGGSEMSLYSLDNLIMSAASSNVDMNTYDAKLDIPNFETHVFATKDSPVVGLHFTRRNLLLGVGSFDQ